MPSYQSVAQYYIISLTAQGMFDQSVSDWIDTTKKKRYLVSRDYFLIILFYFILVSKL
jgi:hypothetical protein